MDEQAIALSEVKVPAEIRELLMARATRVRVRKDQVVVAVGLASNDVYLIVEGGVTVTLMSAQGRETILRTIGPDEIFGELAAIDGASRSANVVAVADSVLAVLSGAAFRAAVEQEPRLALWLARHLTTQIRYLTNRVYELSNLAVGSRLQCELLRLALEVGVEGDAAVIRKPPTQAQLAARIGTNRETVTREMSLLASDGLIRKSGRQIEIPSLQRLGRLVRNLSASA